MTFDIVREDPRSSARAGVIHTAHGDIPTPIFMPVGTAGSVKAVHQRELREDIDAKIILGNTYHLYLRPGLDILRKAGGLHGFNGWERPLLTDSGGFQVFSLAENRKIKEEGCTFRSHIDGSRHLFTPEGVMDIERVIGADIMMAFDECAPGESDYRYAKRSMELTHRWLDRCVKRFGETEPLYGYQQSLFPIVQGCKYADLRRQSAEYIASKGADGTITPVYSGNVSVLNGTGESGVASNVANKLNGAGFTAAADNAPASTPTTVIVYNGDGAAKAAGVAEKLGLNVTPAANDGSYNSVVDVVVVLGSDYKAS